MLTTNSVTDPAKRYEDIMEGTTLSPLLFQTWNRPCFNRHFRIANSSTPSIPIFVWAHIGQDHMYEPLLI